MHTNNLREKPARLSAQVQSKAPSARNANSHFGFGIASEGSQFRLEKI
jgi:hypothetical protein